MKSTTFSDFRRNAAKMFTEVENGSVIRILRHGKPIADVVPIKTKLVPSWKKNPPKLMLNGASLTDAILANRKESKR
jgi:antitoxin (DNA-binding transcriptional repressor) of toxin-antitoxin stability system